MVLDRNPDNFFAETEQVAFLPTNIAARHRLLGRSAAAGPPVLLSGHPAVAAGHGRTSTRSRSTAPRAARSRTCSATATCRRRCPRAAPTTSRTAWPRPARSAARARTRRAASAASRCRSRSTKVRLRAETLRRPLQPGAAVLPLADRDRAGAPGLRPRVRAVEGHARARPQAHAGQPAQRRRDARQPRRRRPECRAAAEVQSRRSKRSDMEPSPALRIVGKYPPTLKGRAVGILVTDGADGAVIEAVRAAVEAEGATVKIVAPKIGGVKLEGRQDPRGRRPAGRHAVGAVRRRGAGAVDGRLRAAAGRKRGGRLREGRLRPPQGDRLHRRTPSRCSTRPASSPTPAWSTWPSGWMPFSMQPAYGSGRASPACVCSPEHVHSGARGDR